MRYLAFTIPVPPQQKRSTFSRAVQTKDNRLVAITHANPKNRPVELNIKQYAQKAGFQGPPRECPIIVTLCFYFPFLKSWSKKKKESAEDSWHTKKPDIDRLSNMVFDALTGYVWKDDSQIAYLDAIKRYSAEPRTEVSIEFVDDDEAEGKHPSSCPVCEERKDHEKTT